MMTLISPRHGSGRKLCTALLSAFCFAVLSVAIAGQRAANPAVNASQTMSQPGAAAPGVPLDPSAHPLVIGSGDTLNVAVFDTPTLSFQGRVDESGKVNAPVLGAVDVAGMTTVQAAQKFETLLLSHDIMHQPSVTVTDAEFATQGIVVLGEVHTPGTYTLLGPHTLYDALSAAGGPTDTEGPKITITHHGDPQNLEEIAVNSPNFSELQRTTRVYPGDTIFVSKADVVYVVGDVGHPGAYYMQHGKPLTVLNLLALAAGDNPTANEGKASIIRTEPGGVTTVAVNLHDLKRNKAPDVALHGDDILVLPRSTSKLLLSQILPGATVSVTSAVVTALAVR